MKNVRELGVTGAFLMSVVLPALSAPSVRAAPPQGFPDWAFPGANIEPPKAGWDGTKALGLPGAKTNFTQASVHNTYAAPDWFPQSHPAPPAIVLKGRQGILAACGYCHLPDGSGRPENASLSGLPVDYIRAQVAAFRSGTRKAAMVDWVPNLLMAKVAAVATDQEVAEAAAYFAAIPAPRHVRVIETEWITGSEAKAYLLRAIPGAGEALGERIVEGPADFDRFERRDPRLTYTAFVPLRSLERGKALAHSRNNGLTQACATCHGEGLKGGANAMGPPLAGRSPSYLFRQLYGFSTGARGGTTSQPMRGVVAHLSVQDMIALAAYAGSLPPR